MFGYLVFASKEMGLTKEDLINFKEVGDARVAELVEGKNWREILKMWKENKDGWYTFNELGVKSDHANLIWYVLGSRAYKDIKNVHDQVSEMLIAWENREEGVWELWRMILEWSDKGYEETYKRIGSEHDWQWRESEHFEQGKDIVQEGLEKGVFRKSEGAIVTDLEKFGLSDTVAVKADGTALYLTQDLALTKLKMEKFPSDLYVWDIGMEQNLYFQQLFTVCEQLGMGNKDKFLHLSYALVNMKGGKKMSTRRGDVVSADEILDLMKERAKEIMVGTKREMDDIDSVAESVGQAALKYGILKVGRDVTMFFDPEESLSLEGDSGPYIQYSYARAKSVLRKLEPGQVGRVEEGSGRDYASEELALLRYLYRFPEVVELATKQCSPNLICTYLYDLSKRFNNFYANCPIIEDSFRIALTEATSYILKRGLMLLGIEVLERM
jgi:arginyl-tRNA synthetase